MGVSSVPASKPPHVKGAALQDFLGWYAEWRGEARMVAVWSTLRPSTAAQLGPSYRQILPFQWYAAPAIAELMDRIIEGHTPDEVEQMAQEGARVVIQKTLRGLYKAIFSALVNPDRYIRNAHRVWGSFHDTGAVQGIEVAPGHHRLEIQGWRSHHPFIERLNGHAGKELYVAMGCRKVTFEQGRRMSPQGIVYTTNVFFEK